MPNTTPEPQKEPLPVDDARADALWDLLGRARREVSVSQDFARRTAAMARSIAQDGKQADAPSPISGAKVIAFPAWLRRAWVPTAAAAACVALLLVLQATDPDQPDAGMAQQQPQPIPHVLDSGIPLDVEPWEWEMDELVWLDQVVAANDPSALSDDELDFLLF